MKSIMAIISTALLASCAAGGGDNVSKVPAIDIVNFDTTVTPANDFYQYATGGWQKNNPLKDEYARYGVFDLLRENNEYRIKELFADLATVKAEKGSVEQKISDLYNMGLDSVKLNSDGFLPLKDDLAAIANIASREDVVKMIALQHKDVANPFFGIYADIDLKNSSTNILYFVQGGLSMGNRDYYLEESNKEIKASYKEYVEKLFALAGYSDKDAKKGAESVLKIETAIAKASSSNVELRDPVANYNMIDIEEFKNIYDGFDWDEYSSIIGFELPTQVNVGQLKQMDEVNSLVKSEDIDVLKDYLAFNLLNGAASYLGDDAVDASFDFYGKTMSGKQAQQPRWKRALAVPNSSLSEAVGEMYVKRFFPAKDKEKMLEIVANLKKALSIHIDQLDWMSDSTKLKAQEKLGTFYVKIGYPDKWKDYSTLEVDPELSYWENIKRVGDWKTADNLEKLGKPADKDIWYMSPQTVNAYYNPPTNEICFPAAILQPPFFNPDADDAVNYGAIGVVIGHEMTHGFDDQGRQFDKDGNLTDWWSKEDADAFNLRADKLVEQFNKVEVLPGVFANGAFTLGENIADQGGLRVAYTAMKEAQNGVEPEDIDGFDSDERFYLSYATVWGQNIRDEEIARLTNIDPHSLGKWRVNQTLKNIDTFYDAFDITEGDMFIEPSDRVVIW